MIYRFFLFVLYFASVASSGMGTVNNGFTWDGLHDPGNRSFPVESRELTGKGLHRHGMNRVQKTPGRNRKSGKRKRESSDEMGTTCVSNPTIVETFFLIELASNSGDSLSSIERMALENAVLESYNGLLESVCDAPYFREAVAVVLLNESGGGPNITIPARTLLEDSRSSHSKRRDLQTLFKRRFTFGVTIQCKGSCPPEATAFTGNAGTRRWLELHSSSNSSKVECTKKSEPKPKSSKTIAPNPKASKTSAPNPKSSKTQVPTPAPSNSPENTQCQCPIDMIILPTESSFTDVLIEKIIQRQEVRDLPADLGVPDATVELEERDCQEESIFESFVTVTVDGDPGKLTAEEIGLLEEIFKQSYNNLNGKSCDPSFRRILSASFVFPLGPEDLPDETRRLFVGYPRDLSLRKIGFRITASCRDCRGERSLFTGNTGSRHLEQTASAKLDGNRGLQLDVLLEGCFCSVFGDRNNRAPTVTEFEDAYTNTFQNVKMENDLFMEIDSIFDIVEGNDGVVSQPPSPVPFSQPSSLPIAISSNAPSGIPISLPSATPITPSMIPSGAPTSVPSLRPTVFNDNLPPDFFPGL